MAEEDLETVGGPSEGVLDVAEAAVETLGVQTFIQTYLEDMIGPKLEDCAESARNAPVDADMMFIALSLPIMNGIIHIGSKQSNFNEAVTQVMKQWKGHQNPEPTSTLSALVLMYVITEGWKKFKDSTDTERKKVWTWMLQRVGRLSGDMNQ